MTPQSELVGLSHDLMTPAERVELLDRTIGPYVAEGKPKNTKLAYADDKKTWDRYCALSGIPVTAVTKGTFGTFVAWMIREGKAPATIRRRLIGVRVAMKSAGTPIPAPVIKTALEALAREERAIAEAGETRGRGKAPAFTVPELRAMSEACPESLAGARDRALILIGFAIGGRRSEIAHLNVADLVDVPEGLLATVRFGKTGRREVAIPYGQHLATCPVRTWRAWLEVSGLEDGPALRQVDRHGNVRGALAPAGIGDIITRASERAGLGRRTAHGLRSGMATEARRAGHDAITIAPQGGWKPHSREMLGYMQIIDRWTDNPLRGIGL